MHLDFQAGVDLPFYVVVEELKKGLFQLGEQFFIERFNGPMDKFGQEDEVAGMSLES